MFDFLLRRINGKAVKENQRQSFERAVTELNDIMNGMTEKPEISVDLNSGVLRFELPDQMPDEALALPAPEEAAPEKEVAPTA